jgi:hypothetical protein
MRYIKVWGVREHRILRTVQLAGATSTHGRPTAYVLHAGGQSHLAGAVYQRCSRPSSTPHAVGNGRGNHSAAVGGDAV